MTQLWKQLSKDVGRVLPAPREEVQLQAWWEQDRECLLDLAVRTVGFRWAAGGLFGNAGSFWVWLTWKLSAMQWLETKAGAGSQKTFYAHIREFGLYSEDEEKLLNVLWSEFYRMPRWKACHQLGDLLAKSVQRRKMKLQFWQQPWARRGVCALILDFLGE